MLIAILPVTIIVASLAGQIAALVERVEQGGLASTDTLAGVFAGLPGWTQRGLAELGLTDLETLQQRAAEARKGPLVAVMRKLVLLANLCSAMGGPGQKIQAWVITDTPPLNHPKNAP